MMNERERLVELLLEFGATWYPPKLADYLLENGVVVLPCKVGDTVYQRDNAGQIYESTVKNIIYDTDGIAFDERAVGKTIFLTKEEAEQALKGGNEK